MPYALILVRGKSTDTGFYARLNFANGVLTTLNLPQVLRLLVLPIGQVLAPLLVRRQQVRFLTSPLLLVLVPHR